MFRINLPHELPHEPSGGSSEGGSPQPHERGSGIAPASVTLAQAASFPTSPLGATYGGSPPRTPSPRLMVKRLGDPNTYYTDGKSGALYTRDAKTGVAKSVPGKDSSGAHTSTSAATSMWDMTEDDLLDDISKYYDEHYAHHQPEDALKSAGSVAPVVSSPDSQPSTSTAALAQGSHGRISLDAVLAQKDEAIRSGQKFNLRNRTPVLSFHGEKLPIDRAQRFFGMGGRGFGSTSSDRAYVAKQVQSILEDSEYHIDGATLYPSILFGVTDNASKQQFRVFTRMTTLTYANAPIGIQVRDSDVIAVVTIDPGDWQTLQSLYLAPLEPSRH